MENLRNRTPREKVITLIRSVSQNFDDFYAELEASFRLASFPLVFLFAFYSVTIYCHFFSYYLIELSFIISFLVYNFQLRPALDPRAYFNTIEKKNAIDKHPVNNLWKRKWSRSITRCRQLRMPFLYGSRRYYWPILSSIYASLFMVTFYILYYYKQFWLIESQHLVVPKGENILYLVLLISFVITLLFWLLTLLTGILKPIDKGRSLFLPYLFEVKKVEMLDTRTVEVDVGDIKKVKKSQKKLEDVEDYIFRIRDIHNSVNLRMGDSQVSGRVVSIGRMLALQSATRLYVLDWAKVEYAICEDYPPQAFRQ